MESSDTSAPHQDAISLRRQKRRTAKAASTDPESSPLKSIENSPIKSINSSVFRDTSQIHNETTISPISASSNVTRRRRQPDVPTTINSGRNDTTSKTNDDDKLNLKTLVVEKNRKLNVTDQYADKILSLTIHGCDTLQTNERFIHKPAVRVHFLDRLTGRYIEKSDPRRSVVTFFDRSNVATILPVITEPFDVRKNHSLVPKWNENIVYNEEFAHLINDNTIMFFELLELATTAELIGDGWIPIAWAFLKPLSTYGKPHIDSKLRLQFFNYLRTSKMVGRLDFAGVPPVYQVWKEQKRTKHNCTLYVTLKAIQSIESRTVSNRPRLPTDVEMGSKSMEQLLKNRQNGPMSNDSAIDEVDIPWRRMMGQKCRIPNKPVLRIDSGKEGCYTLSFSSTGFYLALATVSSTDQYLIKIYDTITGMKTATLSGHQDLIHDIQWSEDERFLMSASSDGSVRVWDVSQQSPNTTPPLVSTFQHPCFVYTAQFCPFVKDDPRLIITGGYDHELRCWRLTTGTKKVDPVNVLPTGIISGHTSYINQCAFNHNGSRFFSADGDGAIKIWECGATDDGVLRIRFSCLMTVNVHNVEKIPISSLTVHPSGRKLLVHTRDNRLKLLDLRLFRFTTDYMLPPRTRTRPGNSIRRSIISPCGHYIFASGNNDDVCVFSLESAKLLGEYSHTGFEYPVTCISFHPFDHSVAFSSLGSHQPVLVYTWDDSLPPLEGKENATDEYSMTAQDLQGETPLFNVPLPIKRTEGTVTRDDDAQPPSPLRTQFKRPSTLRSLSGGTMEVESRPAHT